MHVYISVVAHGHGKLIRDLDCLPDLSKDPDFSVCILDNIQELGLAEWCRTKKIDYLSNNLEQGFGKNNNRIFHYFENSESYLPNSKFLVLNPDVVIDVKTIKHLVDDCEKHKAKIATINLYKDPDYTIYDNSVRRYTTLFDYFGSIFLGRNPSIIDKSHIKTPTLVDWAAGSFLMFDSAHYEMLAGFDENYFMYCEDIDICLRSDYLYNAKVLYSPELKAVHFAKHSSRSLLSKHLYWHLSSIYKYLKKKRVLEKSVRSKR